MERIGTLLEKLNGQFAAGADAQALLITLQMMQNELLLLNGTVKKNGTNGISIFMPGQMNLSLINTKPCVVTQPEVVSEKLVFELDPEPSEEVSEVVAVTSSLHEMPTFTRQPERKPTASQEVNETVIAEKPSINDVLEAGNKAELGSTLQKDSIKDLRKAISINDRYQFINHLFKGDETAYERSIKTINGFNILPEAQFWIRRELAVKLTWKDEDELVQQFYQLVSRRFM